LHHVTAHKPLHDLFGVQYTVRVSKVFLPNPIRAVTTDHEAYA
jgi:hypothetical protein